MATTQEILEALVQDERFPSVRKGLDAFGQHLEARGGQGLKSVNPLEDVSRLLQDLAKSDECTIWLRSFCQREDVRVAAIGFAAVVRQGGESERLMAAWANRQEPEDIN